jgi:hypothetical protein
MSNELQARSMLSLCAEEQLKCCLQLLEAARSFEKVLELNAKMIPDAPNANELKKVRDTISKLEEKSKELESFVASPMPTTIKPADVPAISASSPAPAKPAPAPVASKPVVARPPATAAPAAPAPVTTTATAPTEPPPAAAVEEAKGELGQLIPFKGGRRPAAGDVVKVETPSIESTRVDQTMRIEVLPKTTGRLRAVRLSGPATIYMVTVGRFRWKLGDGLTEDGALEKVADETPEQRITGPEVITSIYVKTTGKGSIKGTLELEGVAPARGAN